jgi:hypothetical protein
VLEANAQAFTAAPWLQAELRDTRDALSKDGDAANRYRVTADLLASLRDALPKLSSPAARLRALDLSLAAEAENFRAAAELRTAAARAPRGADVVLLAAGVEAAYGTGAINGRERAELRKSFARLAADEIPLGDYLRELRYLGLVPGWGTQGLRSTSARRWRSSETSSRSRSYSSRTSCAAARCSSTPRCSTTSRAMRTAWRACSTSCSGATSAPGSTRSTPASRAACCARTPT